LLNSPSLSWSAMTRMPSGEGATHRRRRDREALGLADRVHLAAGDYRHAALERPVRVIGSELLRPGIRDDDRDRAVRAARKRDALRLRRDAAARRREVDDRPLRIRLGLARDRQDAEYLVRVVHGAGRIVRRAVADAFPQRHAAHEAALERPALAEDLPLQHLAAVGHAEGVAAAGDGALEAAEAGQLVVRGNGRTRQAGELAGGVEREADEPGSHRVVGQDERTGAAAEIEPVADVHEVRLDLGNALLEAAVEAVHFQAPGAAGAEDEAAGGVLRVHPDGDPVRPVLRGGRGLGGRRDAWKRLFRLGFGRRPGAGRQGRHGEKKPRAVQHRPTLHLDGLK